MSASNLFERLKTNKLPVVVDFWAPWCGPCHMIDPAIQKLGQEYKGQVDVWKVNADEHPDVLRKLRIIGIPTLVSFRDGQEVTRRTGAASPAVLGTLFEAALSGVQPAATGLLLRDRIPRVVIGLILLFVAFLGHFSGLYIFLAALSGIILFSAVYDRCPIYKMISSRIRGWLRGNAGQTEA